jgi:subtilisin family serine protease
MLAGYMPLRSTKVDSFLLGNPTADGRGVVIAILDSGVDPGVPGLQRTTTGQPKILDLRDFSGEGRVSVAPMSPFPDGSAAVGPHRVQGFGRVLSLARGPYYAGVLRERQFGAGAAADLNGNGSDRDEFPVFLARGTRGWFAIMDAEGDGTLLNDAPVHDYLVNGEAMTLRARDGRASMSIAVNITERDGVPDLVFYMDNSSHGTHVAGIAAGHDLFDVEGFDGVAPGAFLLGLKIANNARGAISVTGSYVRALNYAADFAQRRSLPLVVNLSYGVGHEREGTTAIDSIVAEFTLRHPDVLLVISAGNDGPGLSTVWFPGSATHALVVCALIPGVYARSQETGLPTPDDVVAWWSSRGGEFAKPDVCAPGIAFSTVPPWRTGDEISSGTSMAAPQVSGAAALLRSALAQMGRQARAADLKAALVNTAVSPPGTTVLDAGTGIPDVPAALRWLVAGHRAGVYDVAAHGPHDVPTPGAYRRSGLRDTGDTVQHFAVTSAVGQPAARFRLGADVPWLRTPAEVEAHAGAADVTLTYDATAFTEPGAYVGTVWAISATDPLGGPQFRLVNTVVVAHTLDEPVVTSGILEPGHVHRVFFDVTQRTGLGLLLELVGGSEVSVHLFEPSGRPHSERRSATVRATDERPAELLVRADDVRPGVYEAVLVGPSVEPVEYQLVVTHAPVTIDLPRGDTVAVTYRGAGPDAVALAASHVGVGRTFQVRGVRGEPVRVQIAPPPWATELWTETVVPEDQWGRMTDFGVTIFDREGRKLADAPLNYALRRHRLPVSPATAPAEIELWPAFAHVQPPPTWSATLRVAFLAAAPLSLDLPGSIWMTPGDRAAVPLVLPRDSLWAHDGFHPIVEIEARASEGPPAVLHVWIGDGR